MRARITTGTGYLLDVDCDEPDGHITVSSSAIYACTIGENIFVEAAHDSTLRNWGYTNVFSGFLTT